VLDENLSKMEKVLTFLQIPLQVYLILY